MKCSSISNICFLYLNLYINLDIGICCETNWFGNDPLEHGYKLNAIYTYMTDLVPKPTKFLVIKGML